MENIMKNDQLRNCGIAVIAVVAAFALAGCGKKSEQTPTIGAAQQAGITADRIASNTVEAANQTADEVKEASDKAVAKTGEILEKAGEEIEKTGENLQK